MIDQNSHRKTLTLKMNLLEGEATYFDGKLIQKSKLQNDVIFARKTIIMREIVRRKENLNVTIARSLGMSKKTIGWRMSNKHICSRKEKQDKATSFYVIIKLMEWRKADCSNNMIEMRMIFFLFWNIWGWAWFMEMDLCKLQEIYRYSHINSNFMEQGFERSKSELTLYAKHQGKAHVFIIVLYLDDLVCIRND